VGTALGGRKTVGGVFGEGALQLGSVEARKTVGVFGEGALRSSSGGRQKIAGRVFEEGALSLRSERGPDGAGWKGGAALQAAGRGPAGEGGASEEGEECLQRQDTIGPPLALKGPRTNRALEICIIAIIILCTCSRCIQLRLANQSNHRNCWRSLIQEMQGATVAGCGAFDSSDAGDKLSLFLRVVISDKIHSSKRWNRLRTWCCLRWRRPKLHVLRPARRGGPETPARRPLQRGSTLGPCSRRWHCRSL
jgi:hypothetical protein